MNNIRMSKLQPKYIFVLAFTLIISLIINSFYTYNIANAASAKDQEDFKAAEKCRKYHNLVNSWANKEYRIASKPWTDEEKWCYSHKMCEKGTAYCDTEVCPPLKKARNDMSEEEKTSNLANKEHPALSGGTQVDKFICKKAVDTYFRLKPIIDNNKKDQAKICVKWDGQAYVESVMRKCNNPDFCTVRKDNSHLKCDGARAILGMRDEKNNSGKGSGPTKNCQVINGELVCTAGGGSNSGGSSGGGASGGGASGGGSSSGSGSGGSSSGGSGSGGSSSGGGGSSDSGGGSSSGGGSGGSGSGGGSGGLSGSAGNCGGGDFLGFPSWSRGLTCKGDTPFLEPGKELGMYITIILLNIVDILLRLASIVAFIVILYGGIRYVVDAHAGKSLAESGAKMILVNGVIGLIVAISAAAIVTFVVGSLSGGH